MEEIKVFTFYYIYINTNYKEAKKRGIKIFTFYYIYINTIIK